MPFTFQWTAADGAAVRAGDFTVTPRARALMVGGPQGGVVWQFPSSVLVEGPGGTRRVPIVDVTTIAWLALLGVALVALVRRSS
jgi:MYXO-CTERM domain-containing protein